MAAKKTLLAPVASSAHELPLVDIRTIASKRTGEINYVLVFDNAEVIMPGGWKLRESEFPEGLYEGIVLNAYWDENNRFHLEAC